MTYDYPYLRAFLTPQDRPENEPIALPKAVAPRPAKTAQSSPAPLLAALAVSPPKPSRTHLLPENRGPEAPLRPPCDGCGVATWLALLASDGARTCIDCLTGRTAMRARGVPI